MIGTVIDGKYRIVSELGSGAMGAVYIATHTGTGGRVALKVITGDLAHNADIVKRFKREAMAAGIIDSQYVTKVFDTGVDPTSGRPYLVMELLSGQDFDAFLTKSGPISADLALRVIAQACIGLQKAHEAGVIHRDIKPANMFLARREEGEVIVKLLDFGIAKMSIDPGQDGASMKLTAAGHVPGSPLYMSPEQALSKADLDARSDIWSLGVALYEALGGRTPFHHITDYGALIMEINAGRLQPIQELAPWVPPEVAAVVHGALRRDRTQRFQSAAEMLAAIKPLLPYGWALNESMLVPLGASARVEVQPRLPMPSSPSLIDVPIPAFPPEVRPSVPHATSPSQTGGTMARSNAAPSPRKPTSPIVPILGIGGSLLTLAVLVFAIRAVLGDSSQTPPPAPSEVTSATPAPPPTAPPTTTQAPSPTPTPSVAPVDKQFLLAIDPPFASVEVDGKPVEVHNGTVELAGPLGRVFNVRVFKKAYGNVTSVTISEKGLIPPIAKQVGSGSSSGATPGPTTTTPKPPPTGLDRKIKR